VASRLLFVGLRRGQLFESRPWQCPFPSARAPKGDTMRPYREIAALAGLQVICFLFLSHLEPNFFLLHFYQTVVYLAILIMLFYMEDRWAYMIGIIAPAIWLLMTFASGLLGGALRQVLLLGRGQRPTNPVSLLAAVTALLSVLMIAVCTRRWMKEYSGLGKSATTFAISLGIVAVYYGILVIWFWHMIPFLKAQN
jgi:hypothetical protein